MPRSRRLATPGSRYQGWSRNRVQPARSGPGSARDAIGSLFLLSHPGSKPVGIIRCAQPIVRMGQTARSAMMGRVRGMRTICRRKFSWVRGNVRHTPCPIGSPHDPLRHNAWVRGLFPGFARHSRSVPVCSLVHPLPFNH